MGRATTAHHRSRDVVRLIPVSQRELVLRLRQLGWTGPEYRGKHPYMLIEGKPPLTIPNPHGEDISVDLLKRILRQAKISRDEWLRTS
jgi:predicted RNA binding protein YcfA (HicA-like mRNA interferase family)